MVLDNLLLEKYIIFNPIFCNITELQMTVESSTCRAGLCTGLPKLSNKTVKIVLPIQIRSDH